MQRLAMILRRSLGMILRQHMVIRHPILVAEVIFRQVVRQVVRGIDINPSAEYMG